MTVAPRSARTRVTSGPIQTRVRSTTRNRSKNATSAACFGQGHAIGAEQRCDTETQGGLAEARPWAHAHAAVGGLLPEAPGPQMFILQEVGRGGHGSECEFESVGFLEHLGDRV